ncbi:MAG: hypothetical protein EPO27_05605 [Betaproteobacteria bacterium]|nr:MAG: hypothetical protein EPO27_05605 [Betaproteobacteria bacterium]
MDESQPPSPRARLQQLLAIPERQRTDADWEALNELEIALASVNREDAPLPGARQPGAHADANRQSRPGGPPGRKPMQKFHRRQPKGRGR